MSWRRCGAARADGHPHRQLALARRRAVNSRLAILAQAISSTSPTVTISTTRAVRIELASRRIPGRPAPGEFAFQVVLPVLFRHEGRSQDLRRDRAHAFVCLAQAFAARHTAITSSHQ